MFSTDPIADMLTRIRNALMLNREFVMVPYSKMKNQLALEIKKAGFIDNVELQGEGMQKQIKITLRGENTPAKINHIERVSKPGRRMYAKSTDIPNVMGGRGVVVVSTSRGLMLDHEARKDNIGGELICKVY